MNNPTLDCFTAPSVGEGMSLDVMTLTNELIEVFIESILTSSTAQRFGGVVGRPVAGLHRYPAHFLR